MVKLLRNSFAKVCKNLSYPNYWDLIAFAGACSIIVSFAWSARQMTAPYQIGSIIPISLNLSYLPLYALRTVLRMFIALFFALLFTLVVGTWAAKSKRAALILIPLIDILQSVPILGFLSITVVGFIKMFPGSLLGPECAAIFAIFTSQAWNLVLGFYQSMRSIPRELLEVARMFHLSAWQSFWRIEVSYALPTLLWNMMVSMSAAWFFVVAAEAISIANQTILLPGIGSYIAVAIEQANVLAIGAAIVAMFVVILLYDQLFFRPLVSWSEKFKAEPSPSEEVPNSWFLDLLTRTRWIRIIAVIGDSIINAFINLRWRWSWPRFTNYHLDRGANNSVKNWVLTNYYRLALLILAGVIGHLLWLQVQQINLLHLQSIVMQVSYIVYLGLLTALRVAVLVVLCSVIWVPIGVYIGIRPRLAKISQPVAQFLAAFPANLFYPLVVMAVVCLHVNPEIGLTPLMILGAQWYILFNVIAGASLLPKEFLAVANNFGVRKWLRWRRILLPAIFPHYVTGAITAAGGAWNASIVAETVAWGNTKITVPGLGSYIATQTTLGNFSELAIAIGIMSLIVVLINRLFWHPLYTIALSRYT